MCVCVCVLPRCQIVIRVTRSSVLKHSFHVCLNMDQTSVTYVDLLDGLSALGRQRLSMSHPVRITTTWDSDAQ